MCWQIVEIYVLWGMCNLKNKLIFSLPFLPKRDPRPPKEGGTYQFLMSSYKWLFRNFYYIFVSLREGLFSEYPSNGLTHFLLPHAWGSHFERRWDVEKNQVMKGDGPEMNTWESPGRMGMMCVVIDGLILGEYAVMWCGNRNRVYPPKGINI